jgi:two-component system, NarL family, nitrate/nitrite response regulator NarL
MVGVYGMLVSFTVLVVDDDPLYRHLLKTLIARSPAMTWVGEAADGRKGIALAASIRPDLVILDHQMPGLVGLDVVPLIRLASPNTKIVFHSGATDAGLQARARAAGAHAFMPKDIDLSDFVPALERTAAA